jgi:RNase P/RNase MRP subunit p30
MRSELPMPDYYDLGVRFWEADLESYASSLGFRKICSLSPDGNGVEIKESLDDLKPRGDGKIILFSSTNPELLKKACKKNIGMLLFSAFLPDVGLVRTAAENKKPFEVPISLLLERSGVYRAFMMSKISFFLKICNKYKADFILTSGATSRLSMKSPRELIAIGEMLGLYHDQAVKSISIVPEYILEG